MDSRTGKMVSGSEYAALSDEEKKYYIDLSGGAKQELADRDKKLEAALVEETEEDKAKSRQKLKRESKKGKYRNKPCPCKSGKKYKNCCRNALV